MDPAEATRKRLGAWYTPPELVAIVVDGVIADLEPALAEWPAGRPVRICDPACGDGRFLDALAATLEARGFEVAATGADIDPGAVASLPAGVRAIHADSLTHDWAGERFDAVLGNPPFLSQMAATTSRGGSSRHGGGPYADAAAEFLALAVQLADPGHGRIGLVLPQSILGSRDAGPVRDLVDGAADHTWSWWEPKQRLFDASVQVCAIGFGRPATGPAEPLAWTRVVTDRLGIPPVPLAVLRCDGVLADRADLNANFRDEYYALVGAVADDADGPPLVTSGLIDPGRCWWGERTVRFAKRDFANPRVDLDRLSGRFPAWAARKLVPKVLVANQTRVVEAVADVDGAWLPGVPVTTVTPAGGAGHTPPAVLAREIAAMLTCPIAAALCWHAGAGTGLSPRAVRIGPAVLGRLPWPAGDLTSAADALDAGDIVACGRSALAAYGVDGREDLLAWWRSALPG